MNILSIILLGILLLFTGVFVLQKKLIHIMSLGLKIGFVICALLLLTVIFVPKFFDSVAEFTLKQSGTQEKLQELDDSFYINDINQTGNDILEDLEGLFGGEQEVKDDGKKDQGLIEETIYPGFKSLLSTTYKFFTIFISVFGMAIITYLSYATLSLNQTSLLKKRIDRLEKRLTELET